MGRKKNRDNRRMGALLRLRETFESEARLVWRNRDGRMVNLLERPDGARRLQEIATLEKRLTRNLELKARGEKR